MFNYNKITYLTLLLTIIVLSNCYDYHVKIKVDNARLRTKPRFVNKGKSVEKGSLWQVLKYKHGWVRVKGPLIFGKNGERTVNIRLGWLREREFSRVPYFDLKEAVSLSKKKNDVPIRWLSVPIVIIILSALLYLNHPLTRTFVVPVLIIILFLLSVYLASKHRRQTILGSKIYKNVSNYLKDKKTTIKTTDDIWRIKLNFYHGFSHMKGMFNSIKILDNSSFHNHPGGYYLVVDSRFYARIRWQAPPFVASGVFPSHWNTIMDFGKVKLFYVPLRVD